MDSEPNNDEYSKTRLPYEDMSRVIEAGMLARMLARKGVITTDEFEWLVVAAYLRPKIEAMNEENCMEIRQEMLAFLHREDPSPPVQKTGRKSTHENMY